MDYFPVLDMYRKVTSGYTYSVATNNTTIVVSNMYDTGYAAHSYALVYGPETGSNDDGVWIPLDSPTANLGAGTLTFTAPGDLTNKDFLYIGRRITSELDLNIPYLRDRERQVIDVGTTDISSLIVNYVRTGYFKVETTHQGGTVYMDTIEPYDVGSVILGQGPIVADGKHKTIIYGNNRTTNIKLASDTPLPFTIASLEWDLEYNQGER